MASAYRLRNSCSSHTAALYLVSYELQNIAAVDIGALKEPKCWDNHNHKPCAKY